MVILLDKLLLDLRLFHDAVAVFLHVGDDADDDLVRLQLLVVVVDAGVVVVGAVVVVVAVALALAEDRVVRCEMVGFFHISRSPCAGSEDWF